jgi:hypothetical protein
VAILPLLGAILARSEAILGDDEPIPRRMD